MTASHDSRNHFNGARLTATDHNHDLHFALGELDSCQTVGEFKVKVKEILLSHKEDNNRLSDLLATISRSAKRLEALPGGDRLVANINDVSRLFRQVKFKNRDQFFGQAFRSSNAKVQVPLR